MKYKNIGLVRSRKRLEMYRVMTFNRYCRLNPISEKEWCIYDRR